MQFGVLALYQGALGGWFYGNGLVDEQNRVSGVTEADGSFEDLVLKIRFLKSHFPHADMSDDKLVAFTARTVDYKTLLPAVLLEQASGQEVPYPPAIPCDDAQGTSTYTFTVGGHAQHQAAPDANATTADGAAPTALDSAAATPSPADAPAAGDDARAVPGPGAGALALAAALCALLARRRRA